MDEMAWRHRVSARRRAGSARRTARDLERWTTRRHSRRRGAVLFHFDVRHRAVHQPLVDGVGAHGLRPGARKLQRANAPGLCRRSAALARADDHGFDFRASSCLGATMRGQHAGLAIPDFPLAYGKIWPDTSADAVARYNANRIEINGENPITAFQIILQMAHRVVALAIFVMVAACAWIALAGIRAWRLKMQQPESKTGWPAHLDFLAGADCRANRTRRVDDLVQQGRRRGDAARDGRRAGARDRRALVHHCLPPPDFGKHWSDGHRPGANGWRCPARRVGARRSNFKRVRRGGLKQLK